MILLRACKVNNDQYIQLLTPFQMRFPNNEQEFRNMELGIRRLGHILDGHPNNLASQLRNWTNPGRGGQFTGFAGAAQVGNDGGYAGGTDP